MVRISSLLEINILNQVRGSSRAIDLMLETGTVSRRRDSHRREKTKRPVLIVDDRDIMPGTADSPRRLFK